MHLMLAYIVLNIRKFMPRLKMFPHSRNFHPWIFINFYKRDQKMSRKRKIGGIPACVIKNQSGKQLTWLNFIINFFLLCSANIIIKDLKLHQQLSVCLLYFERNLWKHYGSYYFCMYVLHNIVRWNAKVPEVDSFPYTPLMLNMIMMKMKQN